MQHPSALPPHMRKFRPPSLPIGRGGGGRNLYLRRKSELDYSPSSWNAFFTSKKDICLSDDPNSDVFRVYLHEESEQPEDLPVLVLLHGGGFSALTWACFVKSLVELCHIRILAIDIRGHGSSKTSNDIDLSVQTLVNDITKILIKMYNDCIPEFILMGHSMGGALAAHFVDKCQEELITNRVIGLIVIDVVEGTAKESLSQMQQVLRGRPSGFRSIKHAIEWCTRSNQTRNLEAAKISMPGQIKDKQTGTCAIDLIEQELSEPSPTVSVSSDSSFGLSPLNENATTPEQTTTNEINESTEAFKPELKFCWRINLSETEPYWMEWFDNLSQIFLGSKGGAKLLLLAGVDRLDGPMTVGQMQGKFQMQILPRVGHVIQEDDPDSVAQVVASYLVRNRFSNSKVDLERPFPSC